MRRTFVPTILILLAWQATSFGRCASIGGIDVDTDYAEDDSVVSQTNKEIINQSDNNNNNYHHHNNHDDQVQDVSNPTNLLLLSEGRSGSTLLLKMLADLNDTMVIFEPFHDFSPEAWNGEQGGELPGGIASLFNCEFAHMDLATLNSIFWWPVRMETWVHNDPLVDRAWEHKLTEEDAEVIHRQCLRTKTRIIKVIRFTGYVLESALPSMAEDHQLENFKVLHLVRDLAAVVRSQEKVDWGNRETLVEVMCSHMTQQLPILKQQPSQALMTVDYDVLMGDPVATMRRISSFVGATAPRARATLDLLRSSQDVYRDFKQELAENGVTDAPRQTEKQERDNIRAMLHALCPYETEAIEALILSAQSRIWKRI